MPPLLLHHKRVFIAFRPYNGQAKEGGPSPGCRRGGGSGEGHCFSDCRRACLCFSTCCSYCCSCGCGSVCGWIRPARAHWLLLAHHTVPHLRRICGQPELALIKVASFRPWSFSPIDPDGCIKVSKCKACLLARARIINRVHASLPAIPPVQLCVGCLPHPKDDLGIESYPHETTLAHEHQPIAVLPPNHKGPLSLCGDNLTVEIRGLSNIS
mmetsp:Transcript_39746/g.78585  ORF Transcript_39746/g.78585 Transcript_39746/m.78585 type:complete len:212 (+) Transcript_39746:876-1511(+)